MAKKAQTREVVLQGADAAAVERLRVAVVASLAQLGTERDRAVRTELELLKRVETARNDLHLMITTIGRQNGLDPDDTSWQFDVDAKVFRKRGG